MTARRVRPRPSAQSYTARLQRRMVPRSQWRLSPWLRARWLLAGLMLGAEAGHLGAAAGEWQAALPRGVFHVLIAAVLGFVAAGVLFGPNRLELHFGLAAISIALASLLAGSLVGAPLYRDWPFLAAGALSILDIVVAALLIVHRGSASP